MPIPQWGFPACSCSRPEPPGMGFLALREIRGGFPRWTWSASPENPFPGQRRALPRLQERSRAGPPNGHRKIPLRDGHQPSRLGKSFSLHDRQRFAGEHLLGPGTDAPPGPRQDMPWHAPGHAGRPWMGPTHARFSGPQEPGASLAPGHEPPTLGGAHDRDERHGKEPDKGRPLSRRLPNRGEVFSRTPAGTRPGTRPGTNSGTRSGPASSPTSGP